jgi:hypothetical protein
VIHAPGLKVLCFQVERFGVIDETLPCRGNNTVREMSVSFFLNWKTELHDSSSNNGKCW